MIEMFKVRSVSLGANSRAVFANLFGAGADNVPDEENEAFESAEVAHPSGLIALPAVTDTLECIVVRDGDEIMGLFLVDKGAGTASTSGLAAGEVRLHGVGPNNKAATITIKANGDIEITPKSGQNVIVNGGSTKVAAHGDSTSGHQHNGTGMTAGPYPVSGMTMSQTDTINVSADRKFKTA